MLVPSSHDSVALLILFPVTAGDESLARLPGNGNARQMPDNPRLECWATMGPTHLPCGGPSASQRPGGTQLPMAPTWALAQSLSGAKAAPAPIRRLSSPGLPGVPEAGSDSSFSGRGHSCPSPPAAVRWLQVMRVTRNVLRVLCRHALGEWAGHIQAAREGVGDFHLYLGCANSLCLLSHIRSAAHSFHP